MDNAVARLVSNAEKLQASGETMGDPFELSRIRREDFRFHSGRTEGDDIFQALNKPSTKIERGHQGPSAFLIMASGLDRVCGYRILKLEQLSAWYTIRGVFKFCCFEVAGSAGDFPDLPTSAPILA